MGMTKMGVAAIFETRGNDDCHVILRGGKAPNYDAAGVAASCAVLRAAGLPRAGDDRRLARQQRQAARAPDRDRATSVAEQIAAGERRIFGVMIESHLEAGRQDLVPGVPLRHGVSITDACIGFDADGAGAALARLGRRGAAAPALIAA